MDKKLTSSRKFWVMVATTVVTMVNDITGNNVGESALQLVIAVVVAWLIGQGIADHGAQGTLDLKAKLTSLKFWAMIATVAIAVINDIAGQPVEIKTIQVIGGVICAWEIGQGIADHGAQGKKATPATRREPTVKS